MRPNAPPRLTTTFLSTRTPTRDAQAHIPTPARRGPQRKIRNEPTRRQKWGATTHHSQPMSPRLQFTTRSVARPLCIHASWDWANTTNWRAGATADGTTGVAGLGLGPVFSAPRRLQSGHGSKHDEHDGACDNIELPLPLK